MSVATLAGEATHGPDKEVEGSSTRLTTLGRYVVIRPIGSGGMGAVYVAYDPELDRKVALKLLHGEPSAKHRRGLLMEAQAMARLTHPNVVAVHDVGEHEQTVYLAMEFVDGVTLRDWLAEERRTWRVVLDRFLDAGRGLEAAHARGLIHRDFKPDNVMIAASGRLVVLDFGLARPTRDAASEQFDDAALSGGLLIEATVGRVAGTPAYMAPEQAMAGELTPAVDQFAFCVSLWEALYGRRPFEGQTYPQMLANISDGTVRSTSRRRAPRWLRRCLLRGLRADPDRRWASMHDLLSALDRGRGRWRWQAGMLALVAAGVPVAVSAEQQRRQQREHDERTTACATEGDEILHVWNDEARARLRSGMLSTGVSFAEGSVDTLVPWLDDFAETWKRGRTEVCLHANVQRDWTEEDARRALWCLEDRQLQLEATVDQISAGDRTAARRAVRLASYLDPIDGCLDRSLLERLPAPPEELQDDIRGVRARLIASDRLRHRGEVAGALEHAVTARELAEGVAWPPLLASARLIEGRCLLELGRRSEATPVLVDAFFESQRVGSTEVAFRSARSLVSASLSQREYEEALIWSRHADAVARDKTDPGRLDEAEKYYLLSAAWGGQGRWQDQVDEARRALDLRSETLGEQHPITAAAQLNLAEGYLGLSQPEHALPLAISAHATWLDAVGPAHARTMKAASVCAQAALRLRRPTEALPFLEQNVAAGGEAPSTERRLADTLYQLGLVYRQLQRMEEAADVLRRAAALFRKHHGAGSRQVAAAQLNRCVVAKRRGNLELATSLCEEAVQIVADTAEAESVERAQATETLAGVRTAAGQVKDGVELRLKALAWREAAGGSDQRGLVGPLGHLGDALLSAGRDEDARAAYQRALAIGAATLEHDDSSFVRPLCGLAEVLLEEGDGPRALATARRAAEIGEQHEIRPPLSSRTAFVLARALDASDESGTEARVLARRARDGYASIEFASKVKAIDVWLDGR